MEQYEFHQPSASRKWEEVGPGIHEMILNQDTPSGRRTLLQKYEIGACTQVVSVHDYIEEILLVEGDLSDTTLSQTWAAGAYAYRKPGMRHGPFKSEKGCVMYITCRSEKRL